ncbi:AraC family transcriptional regulator [Caballeronia ptereochthonis]|uniref:AraC family transcriptional regulator n=1 Tax=Caballeronia ptereochthonis TaxID=1777144 RepID=A0A158B1Q9_9BURK|nr:AraC family transcriptional regulator [Caballeronia ptereochthonis]SAK64111.1 AraC family transcriptional regulator [Caballeronia ptereochthonis]
MSALIAPDAAARIDRFSAVAGAPGLEYCISGPRPYSLELRNSSDMICLLLGTIVSETRYDDGPAAPFTFRAETAAYHPRGGSMRIDAHDVRHGFIAFRYSDAFVSRIADRSAEPLRRAGSRSNLGADSIRHLVRYARQKASAESRAVDPWEMQCVATLAWIETTRQLERTARACKSALTDAGFAQLEAYVADNIDQSLSCADIAAELDLPVRAVFDGVKARTGHSLYRYVLEKRIGAAAQMLRTGDAPLVDVAAACGFSSQQHMTALFSERLGTTPRRYRNGAA